MSNYYSSLKKPQLIQKIKDLEEENRTNAISKYKLESAEERVTELENKIESMKRDREGGRAYEDGVSSTLRRQVEYFQSIFRVIALPSDKLSEIRKLEEEWLNEPKRHFNYNPNSEEIRQF